MIIYNRILLHTIGLKQGTYPQGNGGGMHAPPQIHGGSCSQNHHRCGIPNQSSSKLLPIHQEPSPSMPLLLAHLQKGVQILLLPKIKIRQACVPLTRQYLLIKSRNKIIMKVTRQRNPYLKRIFSQQPHKYSYDIDRGKYYLLDQQGQTMLVNPNGTFRPKFTPNFSGFVDHKSRYKEALNDPTLLHFAPDPQPQTAYHNPVPDKFSGYAQFPYQLSDGLPKYLRKPSQEPSPKYVRQKAQSLILGKQQKRKEHVSLLQSTLSQRGAGQQFFNEAWQAMTETKPLPKQKKKTCYNYKCKYLKQWVFDERGKLQGRQTKAMDQTLGRSFHEGALAREMQESKLISTMAMTGAGV